MEHIDIYDGDTRLDAVLSLPERINPDAQGDADVQAAVSKVAEELGDTGRILVRESGTEPVIRVMVEAETDEICEKYVDQVIKVIEEKGHLV